MTTIAHANDTTQDEQSLNITNPKLFNELVSYGGEQWALESIEDYYMGAYDSEQEFADQQADEWIESMAINDHILRCYFDYNAFRRDLFISDYISFDVDYVTHIFIRH